MDETLLKHIVEEDIADLSMVQSGHVRNTRTLTTLPVSALLGVVHGQCTSSLTPKLSVQTQNQFELGVGENQFIRSVYSIQSCLHFSLH